MTTILLLTAVAAFLALLVSYARHDHFAGPAASAHPIDELGSIEERRHLVPRP